MYKRQVWPWVALAGPLEEQLANESDLGRKVRPLPARPAGLTGPTGLTCLTSPTGPPLPTQKCAGEPVRRLIFGRITAQSAHSPEKKSEK